MIHTRTPMLLLLASLIACNGASQAPKDTAPDCEQIDFYRDLDGDGYGDPADTVVDCPDATVDGYVDVGGDCDDNLANINPDAIEVCDGRDEDCSGVPDDNAEDASYWFADSDGDGYGDPKSTAQACSQPPGHVAGNTDCDDSAETTYPGAPEICDGIDQDCDGTPDDGLPGEIYYADADGDGYGDPKSAVEACAPPPDHVINASDCDDSDGSISPAAPELCNGVDDDCDELADEEEDLSYADYYVDADGDGYGDPSTEERRCDDPSGMVEDGSDCDDTDPAVYPGADEVCNGLDDDCDGLLDDADPGVDLSTSTTWYPDEDLDGWGVNTASVDSCGPPGEAWATELTDCDDDDPLVNPGLPELCNGYDDDCNGLVDLEDPDVDLKDLPTWYTDVDGDGYGDPDLDTVACTVKGASLEGTDCDDADPTVFPGAEEVCEDGIDQDCDTEDASCDGHMTEPFYPTDSQGQWCYSDALVHYAYFGETTFEECEALANITGTQWFVGQYTDYPEGWIGEAGGSQAVRTHSSDWQNEVIVPRDDTYSCVLGQFDHRSEPTVSPAEQRYTDAEGRDWVYWEVVGQTHSQAIAFADNRGARIVSPESVGRSGEAWMTAPTHWCHAGAEFNGSDYCNSDNTCDFLVGYWE